MKIVALAGGVGGAKLADGLAQNLAAEDLTVIVNVGDDFTHMGLYICPDLDTVCYTLSGLANPDTGWGRSGESWTVYDHVVKLGGPDWFHLGDKDIATHLERTQLLKEGKLLSEIAAAFCDKWGVPVNVLPVSNDPIPTMVSTKDKGELGFQDYFVRNRCEPVVTGFRFVGIEKATLTPGIVDAIRAADGIIICPSNPYVSIAPVLSVPGMMDEVKKKKVAAVSPIVGGKAIKGPAAKMFQEMGIDASSVAVARQYQDFLTGFILDTVDAEYAGEIQRSGIIPLVTNTVMQTIQDRKRLASEVLSFCEGIF